MEQTECSETSAYKLQMLGTYPKRKHTKKNPLPIFFLTKWENNIQKITSGFTQSTSLVKISL